MYAKFEVQIITYIKHFLQVFSSWHDCLFTPTADHIYGYMATTKTLLVCTD